MISSLPGILEQQGTGATVPSYKLAMNGTSYTMDIPSSLMAGSRGIMFWFKPATEKNNTTGQQFLIDYDQSTGVENGRVGVRFLTNGTIQAFQRRASDFVIFTITTTKAVWKADEWYHLCFHTHSTRGIELYINGVLVDSDTGITEVYRDNISDLSIGGNTTSNNDYTDCDFKEIKVIDGDIDNEEVIAEMTYHPTGLESNIKEYFPLSEGTGVSTTGVNGTVATLSSATMWEETPYTDYNAINFQSVNDEYIDLGNTLINGVRRVSLWFKPSVEINASSGNFYNPLISRVNLDGTRDHDFAIQFSNGRIVFENRNSGGTPYLAYSTAQTFLTDTWYHVTCQVDATTGMNIYINGVVSGTGNAYTTAIGTEGNDLTIGALLRDSRRFNGEIKGVKIFNDVATASELISEMYSIPDGTDVNLKAYFPFLQLEGDKIYDFKDDYEGTINTTGTVNDMWRLIE